MARLWIQYLVNKLLMTKSNAKIFKPNKDLNFALKLDQNVDNKELMSSPINKHTTNPLINKTISKYKLNTKPLEKN